MGSIINFDHRYICIQRFLWMFVKASDRQDFPWLDAMPTGQQPGLSTRWLPDNCFTTQKTIFRIQTSCSRCIMFSQCTGRVAFDSRYSTPTDTRTAIIMLRNAFEILLYLSVLYTVSESSPLPGNGSTYDQRQTGDYNIHISLKDIRIIALLNGGLGGSEVNTALFLVQPFPKFVHTYVSLIQVQNAYWVKCSNGISLQVIR